MSAAQTVHLAFDDTTTWCGGGIRELGYKFTVTESECTCAKCHWRVLETRRKRLAQPEEHEVDEPVFDEPIAPIRKVVPQATAPREVRDVDDGPPDAPLEAYGLGEGADNDAPVTPPVTPKPRTRRCPSIRELVRLERARRITRLATGFPTLDDALRGGLVAGGAPHVIGGRPGAGKTSFVMQLARTWHRAGHVVTIVAADEHDRGLLVRFGQQEGLLREALEDIDHDEHETAWDALDECLRDERLWLADQVRTALSLEEILDDLRVEMKTEPPSVLIVDSIQKVRASGADGLQNRERVDAVMGILSAVSKGGALVVATSEVVRGNYKGGADETADLAAFKESGGIEYAVDFACLLSPLEKRLFKLRIVKNRTGNHDATINFRMDERTAAVTEEAGPSGETAEDLERRASAKVEALADELEKKLRLAKGKLTSRQDLYSLVKGDQKHKVGAVSYLLAEGRIEKRDEGYRVTPRVVE